MAALPISMEQNCNLELCLSPSLSFSDHGSGNMRRRRQLSDDESSKNSQQQMTIFYNGKVSVADYTEDQAKAIIMVASRQMEESLQRRRQKSKPTTPEPKNCEAGSGLSMKRSLLAFLQKRKNRIQSASPYNQ